LDKTLLSIEQLPKVKAFLKSKSRNSIRTKISYSFALGHFETFLKNSNYKNYDAETILVPILDNKKIDVYLLLDDFVEYLTTNRKLMPSSVRSFVSSIRSYFEHNDIDISTSKYKNRVTLPKIHKTQAEAIDAEDIRKMLLACTNSRLKCFILLLATTGLRANEALALRNSDIDFDNDSLLTKIHIRAAITKTKTERNIYTTQECSKELKSFLDSKYTKKGEWKRYPDHLFFKMQKVDEEDKGKLYARLSFHFANLLDKIGMNQRKEGQTRRKISFHSFRRLVKSTISDIDSDYSEYYIGHSGSSYWTKKEHVKQEKYKQCEKYLTFLDYHTLRTASKDIEVKLEQSTKMIEDLEDQLNESEQNREWDTQAIREMNKEIKDQNKQIEDLQEKINLYEFNESHNNEAIKQMLMEIAKLKKK
jgi:integrase